jgi:hypothetical protein
MDITFTVKVKVQPKHVIAIATVLLWLAFAQ